MYMYNISLVLSLFALTSVTLLAMISWRVICQNCRQCIYLPEVYMVLLHYDNCWSQEKRWLKWFPLLTCLISGIDNWYQPVIYWASLFLISTCNILSLLVWYQSVIYLNVHVCDILSLLVCDINLWCIEPPCLWTISCLFMLVVCDRSEWYM